MSVRPSVLMTLAGHALGASVALGATGPSTLQSPYIVPADPASGVSFVSIASNGNGTSAPNEFYTNANTGMPTYRMVGIVDGMGAFQSADDVQNGTFTLLVNHELGGTSGIARAHGNRGAFVSTWTIRADGANLEALGAKDLITNVHLWSTTTSMYTLWNAATPMLAYANNVYGGPNPNNNGFERFCSADLPGPGAYRFGELGTDARIFLNGEESGAQGRGMAHIASGPEAGHTYELPTFGDYSWENLVANPHPQLKTVLVGADDSTPGNIYLHVGTKQATGNEVERAGLANAATYLVGMNGTTVVGSQRVEDRVNILGNAMSGPVTSKRFFCTNMNDLRNVTGASLQSMADAAGQMNFLRPEDFAWDPSKPNDGYFVTTDSFTGNTRLWLMRFDDIASPEQGGVITMLVDGSNLAGTTSGVYTSAGLTDARMFDNMCVSTNGKVLITEDCGNNPRLARTWSYDIYTDSITEVGISDPARFLAGGAMFLTQDEETSGVIDVGDILGPGWFLLNQQAHFGIAGELAEGAQILAMYVPAAALPICDGDANGDRIVNMADLNILLTQFGSTIPGLGGDMDEDGDVDFVDLNVNLTSFGDDCNTPAN